MNIIIGVTAGLALGIAIRTYFILRRVAIDQNAVNEKLYGFIEQCFVALKFKKEPTKGMKDE